ncbi:hypothetical protein GJR95_10145 [Spirosoma endbachense]|uniref:Uncharacterized protein n=1 Tax=Spirosoma endbachense TaxID=2666025 RepID=A0A6P1VUC0_9BACT|nr:hypothetical protein [Spirosoma endbachense]QHV95347.1 hypothetical protein GJR95_10145 [Spirosoma endbachense]
MQPHNQVLALFPALAVRKRFFLQDSLRLPHDLSTLSWGRQQFAPRKNGQIELCWNTDNRTATATYQSAGILKGRPHIDGPGLRIDQPTRGFYFAFCRKLYAIGQNKDHGTSTGL